MQTKVINLWGGPSAGKSTLAAEIYAQLKKNRERVEFVSEWIKDWAWEGKKPSALDGLYIMANQFYKESRLYGLVPILVTDSPVGLTGFYTGDHALATMYTQVAQQHRYKAMSMGVAHYYDFIVSRDGRAYDTEGRYQTQEQAVAMDCDMMRFVFENFDSHAPVLVGPNKFNAVTQVINKETHGPK